MSAPRFEVAIVATLLVMALMMLVGGVTPSEWVFWYSIPALMVGVGLLSGSRAYARAVQGHRSSASLFLAGAALLITLGLWFGLEHYWATPIDMNGHFL